MPDTAQLEIAYRLASACCYQPDRAWIEENLFSELVKATRTFSENLSKTAEAMELALDNSDLQSLLVDYSALFVGPGTLLAAPYGSVYLEKDRQVMGETTMAALGCYRSAGLNLTDDFTEMPDHIAVELEFCSYLLQRQLQSEIAGDQNGVETWQTQRADFLKNHLAVWAPPFCSNLHQNAATSFYKELAELIQGIISSDPLKPVPKPI